MELFFVEELIGLDRQFTVAKISFIKWPNIYILMGKRCGKPVNPYTKDVHGEYDSVGLLKSV